MDSEIINELVSRVMHGFDSPNSPYGLRNNQRTAIHVTHGFDIYSPNSRRDSVIINELLNR